MICHVVKNSKKKPFWTFAIFCATPPNPIQSSTFYIMYYYYFMY